MRKLSFSSVRHWNFYFRSVFGQLDHKVCENLNFFTNLMFSIIQPLIFLHLNIFVSSFLLLSFHTLAVPSPDLYISNSYRYMIAWNELMKNVEIRFLGSFLSFLNVPSPFPHQPCSEMPLLKMWNTPVKIQTLGRIWASQSAFFIAVHLPVLLIMAHI